MDIPNPQSQNPGPKTSGLDPATPGIVGGNAIVQGLGNVAQGMLVYAHYQQQQMQIDQANSAAKHLSGVVEYSDQLWGEIQDAQRRMPTDPRDAHTTFRQLLDKNIEERRKSPDLQGQWAKAYFNEHLPQMLSSRLNYARGKTEEQLQRFHGINATYSLESLERAQMNEPDPTQRSESAVQAKALITGMAMMDVPGFDQKTWGESQARVTEGRARSLMGTDHAGYLEAYKKGTTAQFFKQNGLDETTFTSPLRKELHSLATQTRNDEQTAQTQAENQAKKKKTETHEATDRAFMSKYLLHEANDKNPALTTREVSKALTEDSIEGPVGRAYHQLLKADTSATRQSDVHVKGDLYHRLNLEWGDKEKLTNTAPIIKAVADGKLTVEDSRELVADFAKAKTPSGQDILKARENFLNSKKSAITTSNLLQGKLDTEGDDLYGKFSHAVYQAEAKAEEQNRSPYDLYNPDKPEYLGALVPQFTKTMNQSMKTISKKLQTQETPKAGKARLPEETPEQYMKRTGQ